MVEFVAIRCQVGLFFLGVLSCVHGDFVLGQQKAVTPEKRVEVNRLIQQIQARQEPWEKREFRYSNFLSKARKDQLNLSERQREKIREIEVEAKKKFMDYREKQNQWYREVHPYLSGRKAMVQAAEWGQGRLDLVMENEKKIKEALTDKQRKLLVALKANKVLGKHGFVEMLVDPFRFNGLVKDGEERRTIFRKLKKLAGEYGTKSNKIELSYEEELMNTLPPEAQEKVIEWLSIPYPFR